MGIRFFGHISAIFGPRKLKFHTVTHETIIYRLVMRNIGYFWALIWPQKRCGLTLSHNDPGLQDPTKKLGHGMELLGYSLSQNHVSKNIQPGPPLKENALI